MRKAKAKTRPEEMPSPQPAEQPMAEPEESIQIEAQEAPQAKPAEKAQRICGINGCHTWYDDPQLMDKHRARVHGIPPPDNLNKPKPRNEDVKLA
jgi:hypothetical protein